MSGIFDFLPPFLWWWQAYLARNMGFAAYFCAGFACHALSHAKTLGFIPRVLVYKKIKLIYY